MGVSIAWASGVSITAPSLLLRSIAHSPRSCSLVSLPPPHLFPFRRPWLRSDEMGRGVRSRPAHPGPDPASNECQGGGAGDYEHSSPWRFWRLPERALFCHAIVNRVRARVVFHFRPGDLVFSRGPVAVIASTTRASPFAGRSRTQLGSPGQQNRRTRWR